MPRFLVVAARSHGGDPMPLRWLPLPDSGVVRVREAAAGLEAVEADPDFEPASRKKDSTRLIPPPPAGLATGEAPLRLELASDETGVVARVLDERERPGARVVDLEQGFELGPQPRALRPGRVLAVRPDSQQSPRIVLVAAREAGDPTALAQALAEPAAELDALADPLLQALVHLHAKHFSEEKVACLPWRWTDLALRQLRDLRSPFKEALDGDRRAGVERVWADVQRRVLERAGLAAPVALNDRTRDWIVAVRPSLERVHGFPQLHRDAFALGIARALDALGETPSLARLVPLARKDRRETFRLTLSRSGSPEYHVLDVERTETGDAIVSGRRVQVATPTQRIRTVQCACGGRLYERDTNCRGCGKKLGELGHVRFDQTFMVGTTATVAALCECGAPLGAEDSFCGVCGRSLEDWV